MHIIGRGRYARAVYPVASGGRASVAAANRNVSDPHSDAQVFTPATAPAVSLVAAVLFVPKVSGILRVSTSLAISNGAVADTFQTTAIIAEGTNLSVSGGAVSSNGWVMGGATPPVFGGTVTGAVPLGAGAAAIAANPGQGVLVTYGTNPNGMALPLFVPVVVELFMAELGGGNAIDSLNFLQLSVVEEP